MAIGIVTRVMRDKGYGFIREEGTGHEFFFHRRDCLPDCHFGELDEKDRVTFNRDVDSKERPCAIEVTYA